VAVERRLEASCDASHGFHQSRKNGTFQLCIKNRLLPKSLWATFDTFEAASAYGQQLEGLLAQGIVPASLRERTTPAHEIWTVPRCIAEYVRNNEVPHSDVKLLDTIRPAVLKIGTGFLNYDWAQGWVESMKRDLNLAPSTRRHRHGALARCLEWMVRKQFRFRRVPAVAPCFDGGMHRC
jgi:hypothetical protein